MKEEVTLDEIKEDIFKVMRKHFSQHTEISRLFAQQESRDYLNIFIMMYVENLNK